MVTLESGHDIAKVGKRLADAGLAIEQTLAELGVVIGTSGPRAATRLRAVPGVADVSKETDVSIGPPGSDTTW